MSIAELAVDTQAATLPFSVAARRALHELPDDLWTKIKIEFYADAADAVFNALREQQARRESGLRLYMIGPVSDARPA